MNSTPALAALLEAQKIVFGPIAFQMVRIARNLGILSFLDDKRKSSGASYDEIKNSFKEVNDYTLRLLLRASEAAKVLQSNDEKFTLTATGSLLIRDEMTRVNMDFVHDICYKAAFHLESSFANSKPIGLQEISHAATVYEGLSTLEPQLLNSWLAYDHLYSDGAFKAASSIVFAQNIRSLLDVGGNTGRWARYSLSQNPELKFGLFDLPQQISLAHTALADLAQSSLLDFFAGDILDPGVNLPANYEVIWMSQFLDCFSPPQVETILAKARAALDKKNGVLYILEVFSDRQTFEVGSYIVHMSSPYFTCVANGNSCFYAYKDFYPLIEKSGFNIIRSYDGLGMGHTLLECRPCES